jgi:hypothetical protein
MYVNIVAVSLARIGADLLPQLSRNAIAASSASRSASA